MKKADLPAKAGNTPIKGSYCPKKSGSCWAYTPSKDQAAKAA